jgi:hypothetical protein
MEPQHGISADALPLVRGKRPLLADTLTTIEDLELHVASLRSLWRMRSGSTPRPCARRMTARWRCCCKVSGRQALRSTAAPPLRH